MADIEFDCPQCGSTLEIDSSGAGEVVNCPECSKPIRIPRTGTVSSPDQSPGLSPASRTPLPPQAFGTSATPPPKTSPGAIWSLVLGILSFLCFGPLAAIPAIICGHVALSNIKKSDGATTGNGLAIAGLVLGYISTALLIVLIPLFSAIAIPSFVKARAESQSRACVNNLRIMDAAKEQAAMEHAWQNGQMITPGGAEEGSVLMYIKSSTIPTCPAGGRYEWNPIGSDPECSLGDAHTL